MSKEYWVHIKSTTSYIVQAENEEQAEQIALIEYDSVDFETATNHEWDKVETSEVQ